MWATLLKMLSRSGKLRRTLCTIQYDKDQDSMKDSIRNIIGVSIDHKQLSLVAEYIMSKNDPFIGGTQDSLAKGETITSGISCLT